VHVLGHRAQRAAAALLQQQREEVDLEEHVPQLVQQLGVVAGVRGRRELIRLADRVRNDRALVLLAVPRALAPQPPRQRVEAPERLDITGDVVQAAYWPCGVTAGVGVAFGPFLQSVDL